MLISRGGERWRPDEMDLQKLIYETSLFDVASCRAKPQAGWNQRHAPHRRPVYVPSL